MLFRSDTATADITKLAINIGFTANDKVYDGNTIATRDQLIMDEVLEGDDVSFDDSDIEYNFDTKEPGENKTVTATGYDESMLSGADLQNYDVTFVDTSTADITYLSITILADDKTMIYGDANPSLTYAYEGNLAEGHTISVALDLDIDDADITDSDHIMAGEYADSITAERVKRVINGHGEGKKAVAGTGGDFSFFELGVPIFNGDELNEAAGKEEIRKYIWYTETRQELQPQSETEPYLLGIHYDTAYYFCYEPGKLTSLNYEFLSTVKTRTESYVIYADRCFISDDQLDRWHITFKKIPRDITKI